jgi:hypothetical protein
VEKFCSKLVQPRLVDVPVEFLHGHFYAILLSSSASICIWIINNMLSVLGDHNLRLDDLSRAAFERWITHLSMESCLSEARILSLTEQHFLHTDRDQCPLHHTALAIHPLKSHGDGFILQCSVCGGSMRRTIRLHSFFEKSRLTIIQQLIIVRELYLHSSIESVMVHADTTETTVRNIYIRLTDKMQQWLNEHVYNTRYLFDQVDEVEVDEMYRHWRTETAVGQYAGQEIEQGKWIIGFVSRDGKKLHLELLKSRKIEHIAPIVTRLIAPGTIIYSDALSTYNTFNWQYSHFTINKKVDGFSRFEQLQGGVSINVNVNHIENRWRWLRQLGRERHVFDSKYVRRLCVEYMYRFYNKHFLDLLRTP